MLTFFGHEQKVKTSKSTTFHTIIKIGYKVPHQGGNYWYVEPEDKLRWYLVIHVKRKKRNAIKSTHEYFFMQTLLMSS